MGVDDYRMGEKLGKGAFSTVYKVERKANSTSYACKRIDISKMAKNEISDAVNEIRILSSIRHPYIVGFFDSFLAKSDRELWIVMEMCSCGDLAAKVERYRKKRKYMDERVVWTHLIQMAEGLLCLHEANIVHRDLKAANIFLDENGSVKIGDLNVSKRMKGGHLLKTQIGTPYYMSPEVWLSKPYGMSSDIWALGCLVYELCALRPPFVGNTFPQLKQAVLCGKYPALPRAFSYEMTAIIARMVRINARERPSTRQLLDCTEVKERRAADWYKEPVAYKHAPPQSKQDLMDTIVVPHHLSQLEAALPKACFPDFRPNSPEAWPLGPERDAAMERKANGAQGAPANPRPVRDAPAPPPRAAAPPPRAAAPPIAPRGSANSLHGENAPPQRHPASAQYAPHQSNVSHQSNASRAAQGKKAPSSGYGQAQAPAAPRRPLAPQPPATRNPQQPTSQAAGYNRRGAGYYR